METIAFGTRLIGQTEKTLSAILVRRLDGTGLSEPDWVVLNLAATPRVDQALDEQVAGVLHVSIDEASDRVRRLVDRGLLESPERRLTAEGASLVASIRQEIGQITDRLWGDLPADDLDTAARVLSTVLDRARAEAARQT